MKFSQLTEDAPDKDIRNLIMSIALSLVASGRQEVSVQSLVNEIKKRNNIDVPYNVLMDILNSLPFVQDATSDMVQFSGADEQADDVESSEDIVSDMATKAASSSMKQDF